MILSNIVCTRWVGQDFGKWVSRIDRYICPLIIGLDAWLICQLLGIPEQLSLTVAFIATVAFPLWRYDGWGEQNLAMHGDKKHYDRRNKNKFVTKIADWILPDAYLPSERKFYGIVWGGLRGLYDLPAFIIMSIVMENYYIAFAGLLMGLQGFIYFLVRKYIKQDTAPAELALGAWRGCLWLGALLL